MEITVKPQNANPTPATPVLELYQFNTIQAVLLICAVNSLHELVMNAFCVVYFLTHTQTYKHTDIQTYKQPHKHIHTLHRSYNTQLSQDSFSSQLDITASFLILSIFIWRSVLLKMRKTSETNGPDCLIINVLLRNQAFVGINPVYYRTEIFTSTHFHSIEVKLQSKSQQANPNYHLRIASNFWNLKTLTKSSETTILKDN